MEDIRKVNSMQLYYLWKNLAIGLLCIGATIAMTKMLPYYMAPAVALFFSGVLYTILWNNSTSGQSSCMIVVQTIFFSLLGYTFVSVLLVLVYVFGLWDVPHEIIFFNEPYMPALILMPVSFLVVLYVIFFKNTLPVCRQCIARYGRARERGYFGLISSKETDLQLKNMAVLFAVLSAITWWYYMHVYVNINQNGRDWYVFVWIVILAIILDELYFMTRYYNLYLDLQEHNEIITPEELRDITARTYLRYYVICGEYIYMNPDSFDRLNQKGGVLDTPFITKRTVNGVPTSEARKIVEDMTGQKEGELRFFFGRHLHGVDKHSLLRYFYFLDGDISMYGDMGMPGKWMHFDEVKKIYSETPLSIAYNALNDLSRVSTIILTERIFDEEGNRKNRIKSYKGGTLRLADIRNSRLDFQDDKWLRIADFNSDVKFFRLKKFARGIFGKQPVGR
ncbi:MAG: hypothetical protein HDS32_04355 [Bacteroides sp.]|nr:hypothetical protein [Bacteroides sp.]